jgi:hypothetical protein
MNGKPIDSTRAQWRSEKISAERSLGRTMNPAQFSPPTAEERKGDAQAWLDRQPLTNFANGFAGEDFFPVSMMARVLLGDFGLEKKRVLKMLKRWAEECDPAPPWHSVEEIIQAVSRDEDAKNAKDALPDELAMRYELREYERGFLSPPVDNPWIIEGALIEQQACMIGGSLKTCKTLTATELAISSATRTTFLNHFVVPRARRVMMFLGETDPYYEFGPKFKAICAAKGVHTRDVLDKMEVCFKLPRLDTDEGHDELSELLMRLKINVVVLDPTYKLFGPKGAANATSLFEMGSLYSRAAKTCLEVGCTPVFVHHANRELDVGRPMELRDSLFAGAGEFCRQWLLLSRQHTYDPNQHGKHDLILNYGGSSFHGGLLSVQIDEGHSGKDLAGRKWQVEVSEYKPESAGKQGRRTRAAGADQTDVVLHAVKNLTGTEGEVKRQDVQRETRLSGTVLKNTIEALEKDRKLIVRKVSQRVAGKEIWTHYLRLPESGDKLS